MTRPEPAAATKRRRVVLLFGQAFMLGLTMAWILIPASAIFLAAYGADLLPVTYIGAAVAGMVSTRLLAAALRQRPLARVATMTLTGVSLALVVAWLTLSTANADWVSFVLLVFVPIAVPIGFMFVVGQAGMLLDVRSLKVLYGRVVAGFALGFTAGGLAGSRLLTALGGTENLLAVAALSAGVFVVLVVMTRRSFPVELAAVEVEPAEHERPTLRVLLRNRYVVLIVAFQMLSAVESQWLDFLVMDRAAQRYDDSNALAHFISRFTTIAYGSDILFLLLLAGFLLGRFGLRYGLTANALGVLTVVVAMIAAATLRGSGATVVFVLIVAARVTDLVLSDGTSRTSLSAAYQVVPAQLRLSTQANVEGLAVPVAIGLSGVVLLGLRALQSLDGMVLPVLTGCVVTTWAVVAFRLYCEYRGNLLVSLRRRTLDPAELTIDGAESLLVVDRLLASDDVRELAIGLDVLAAAEHPGLPARLRPLLVDARAGVRANALERLAALDVRAAVAAARDMSDDPSPAVRAACIRVLGHPDGEPDIAMIAARSADPAPEVRVAVAATLTRIGDDAAREIAAQEIARLGHSPDSRARVVAAQMLAECAPGEWLDRSLLSFLLADTEDDVVEAALAAVHWPEDSGLLVDIEHRLADRRTSAAALDALVRAGDAVLDELDRELSRADLDPRVQELLARAARHIGNAAAAGVLRRHIEHPDRDVGLAVLRALASIDPGPHARGGASDELGTAVVTVDLDHASRVLQALVTLETTASAELVRAALRDELGLLTQRILAELSMRHGAAGLERVASQFAQHDERAHALALEWLDVTLTGNERGFVAILEPGLRDEARLDALTRWFPRGPTSERAVLLDLVEDPENRWRRPWIRACALYAASALPDVVDDALDAAEASIRSSGVDDTDIAHETLVAIRGRYLAAP